jgi:rhodanese-related sulfurtransferase
MNLNDPVKANEFFKNKMAFTTGPVELSRKIGEKANIAVIDVRAEEDYKSGHVPGAVNVPKDKWSTLEGIQKNKLNVVYCYSQVCHLAAAACLEFSGKGYSVMEVEGGFTAWKEHKLPIESDNQQSKPRWQETESRK